MAQKQLRLLLSLLLCLSLSIATGEMVVESHHHHHHRYNHTLARILVRYASAVYLDDTVGLLSWTCSRCNGLIQNFRMASLIVEVQHSLQAFVGVDLREESIVVAFRGTREKSIENWMEDLYFKELDFNYPGVEDAKVHHGFYSAYFNTTLRVSILEAINYLVKSNPKLKLMITGHSMGAALASFCALDLVANFNKKHIQVVTFGQPRIGNGVFASLYNEMLPNAIRMTHGHDMIPHLPPYLPILGSKCYHHFPTEVWITSFSFGILNFEYERICDSSGEDPTCSRSVVGNSLTDHLEYLGVYLASDDG